MVHEGVYAGFIYAAGNDGIRAICAHCIFDEAQDDAEAKAMALEWANERYAQFFYPRPWLELTKNGVGIFTQIYENKHAHRT